MKYCLFDGGDVVGPFTAQQLLQRPGFGSHSLVCPEEHSDEEAYWKEAHFYGEFGFEPPQAAAADPQEDTGGAAQSVQFLKEMDTVMTELSSFSSGKKDLAPESPVAASSKGPAKEAALQSPSSENVPTSKQNAQSGAVSEPLPVLAESSQPVILPKREIQKEEKPQQTPSESKEKTAGEEQKISSLLFQASEEMKRRRVGREAVSKAEEQQKKASHNQVASNGEQPEEAAENKSNISLNQTGSKQNEGTENDISSKIETRTVSGASPIEEYFNTIKSGDLGNILGIPDPKENSDMNLVRALESQFEKTDPGLVKPLEDDPFDEFTPKKDKPSAEQDILAEVTEQADKKTEENLRRSLPDLKAAEALPLAGQKEGDKAEEEEDTLPPASVQEMIVPEQEDDPNDRTVKTILEGKLKVDTLRQEIPEPIKEVPAEEKKPEKEDISVQDKLPSGPKRRPSKLLKFVLLAAGVVILLIGAYLNWTQEEKTAEQPTSEVVAQEQPEPDTQAQIVDLPDAREAIHAIAPVPAQDPLELAKEIVQSYTLDKNRGTIEEYLNRIYSKQLQSGYAAVWSAEPLHRNSYVVKYRLAKTRKEPIVYVFQVDTAKKKLTGALNNITLDVVGKIK